MNKAKAICAPGITLTVALVWLLQPQHIWSSHWWFVILGCGMLGAALNISLIRIQAWILKGSTIVNQTFYNKDGSSNGGPR